MSDCLLNVQNLITYFESTDGIFGRKTGVISAVDNISFKIKKSETLSIVGESGCGKSTTGRSLLKLVPKTSGKIIFKDTDISEYTPKQMRKIRADMQMIYQDPFSSLNPRMTIGRAIAEPLKTHNLYQGNDLKDKVNELLIRVGLLPEHKNRYPHEFSGGQRQRICIARALGPHPALIVADEAVSALDVTIQAQIVNLMMDLQEEFGISYLFISHDMAVVERISHKVAVMYLGRIVEIGSRQQVFERPSHSYTKNLLDAVPVADPLLRKKDKFIEFKEIKSTVKPINYKSPPIKMEEIEEGHFISVNG